MEANPIILFVVMDIKTNKPIMRDGEVYKKDMSLEQANAYYIHLSVNKPAQSMFMPDDKSGYIYDKATNSLIKNEPVAQPAVETSGKKVATKPTETVV